jgi:hypothetical protein
MNDASDASFHDDFRRDKPSTDTAPDTTTKISFKPTSRRSSHLQTSRNPPAWHLNVELR